MLAGDERERCLQQLGAALVITMTPEFLCFFIIPSLGDAAVNHPASFFMFNLLALTATAFPSTAFNFSPEGDGVRVEIARKQQFQRNRFAAVFGKILPPHVGQPRVFAETKSLSRNY